MAVVSVKEVTSRDSDADVSTNHRYTRVFQVLTDNPADGAQAVRDDPNVPAYGDAWESIDVDGVTVLDTDPDSVCVSKRATQADGDNFQNWLVTVQYVGIVDPTAQPPKVSWGEEKYRKHTNQDWLGNDIKNAAGDFFGGGTVKDVTRIVVIIEQNVLAWDPIASSGYRDSTNDTIFLADRHPPGFAIGKCKLDSLTAEAVYYPDFPVTTDIQYWRRTAKVSIDPDGWTEQVLNAGFHEFIKKNDGTFVLNPDGSKAKRHITDDITGAKVTAPWPLTTDGVKLTTNGTPNYIDVVNYAPMDWSAIDPPITY